MWQRRQSQESPRRGVWCWALLCEETAKQLAPPPPRPPHHVQVRARLGSCCLPRWQFSRIPSTLPRWAFSWHFSIHSFPLSFIHKVCKEPLLRGRRRQKQRRPSCRGLAAGGLQVKPGHPKPGLAPPPRPSWGTMVAPPKRAPSRRANEELHRAGGNGTGA